MGVSGSARPSGARVTGLYVYPVKAMRGVSVPRARLTPTGLAHDRHWMVVDARSGRFVTQRERPELALVDVALEPGAALRLSAPGLAPLEVPIRTGASASSRDVTVWEWTGPAADEGDAAAAWLTELLGGTPARLVRKKEDVTRAVDPDYGADFQTAFSDGFEYLLASEESLADLNARLPAGAEALRMDRFRPNVVVAGAEAWAEDTWEEAAVGDAGAVFTFPKPCARCAVTTVDQQTAKKGQEPLRTLKSFRTGGALGWRADKGWKSSLFFGWNLHAVAGDGAEIAVGDAVDVRSERAFE